MIEDLPPIGASARVREPNRSVMTTKDKCPIEPYVNQIDTCAVSGGLYVSNRYLGVDVLVVWLHHGPTQPPCRPDVCIYK